VVEKKRPSKKRSYFKCQLHMARGLYQPMGLIRISQEGASRTFTCNSEKLAKQEKSAKMRWLS
jgi:hypothetical protein